MIFSSLEFAVSVLLARIFVFRFGLLLACGSFSFPFEFWGWVAGYLAMRVWWLVQ